MSGKGKQSKKWQYAVIILVSAFLVGNLEYRVIMAGTYRLNQNIYFTEYARDVDTTIFKYDSSARKVSEIGKVNGNFYKCIVDSEETAITGALYDKDKETISIARYDLATKELQSYDISETIQEITGTDAWTIQTLYDEGNKFLVIYYDENYIFRWLFYDLVTGQYENVMGQYGALEYLGVHDNILWYVTYSGGILCQYDLQTKTKTEVLESIDSAAVMADKGMIAYTKDNNRRKIYLYDMEHNRTKYLALRGWNTYYYDLGYSESRWSDDGRGFFYVRSFPGLFNSSTKSLMVCDTKSGKRICIYMAINTYHELRYIASA